MNSVRKTLILLFCIIAIYEIVACKKHYLTNNLQLQKPTISLAEQLKSFTLYTILKDSNYSDKSAFNIFPYDSLKFISCFDSSAIYQTKDPVNQLDINKLYGFSDNQTFHQYYSARFGWRWSNDSLRLFGYCYNNSVRSFVELCATRVNKLDTCVIAIKDGNYQFRVNGRLKGTIPRSATITKPYGYMLYPYFGGTEPAPHTVKIYIKEIH